MCLTSSLIAMGRLMHDERSKALAVMKPHFPPPHPLRWAPSK